MDCQDWKPVVFHKKKSNTTHTATQSAQNSKFVQRVPHKSNSQVERTYKEDEDGVPITKGLKKGFGRKMQQARQEKGWTQKELAHKIGERLQVVQDYEQERVINANNKVIRKIEKYLGKF